MNICNFNNISIIDKYIYNWYNNNIKVKPLFIYGNSGCGKSHSINSICNKYNIHYTYNDSFNDFNEIINFLYTNDIIYCLNKKKKILLFDNINDDVIISKLLNLLKTNLFFNKLIIITTNNNFKKNIIKIFSNQFECI